MLFQERRKFNNWNKNTNSGRGGGGGGGGGESRRGFHANGISERKNKKACKFVLNKAELTSFAWSNLWSSSFI